MELYLALGSNLGDRAAYIGRALDMLQDHFGRHIRISEMMESESWGFDAPPFLDCVAVYGIDCSDRDISEYARTVLAICKDIEHSMGRKDERLYDDQGKRIYHDRIIDIDILFLGSSRVNMPDLVIPHPLIAVREFILNPLRQVVSDEICRAFSDIFNK